MERLTEREHWDAQHDSGELKNVGQGAKGGLTMLFRRVLGSRVDAWTHDYSEYLLWDVLYKNYLPSVKGARVLEVGSAPGTHLVQLWRTFGYEPYGVEYSGRGVESNRRLFQVHGLDPHNVIHDDFFSPQFQTTHANHFDIVVSRGFIEHFTDPEAVIDHHLNVLRPGGHLVVTIPNLCGVNYALARFFHREVVPMHNVTIMRHDVFCRLFRPDRFSPLVCGYYGTFSFGIFNARPDSARRHVLRWCGRVQRFLNLLFRLLFDGRGAESRSLSPYLVFIGVKKL